MRDEPDRALFAVVTRQRAAAVRDTPSPTPARPLEAATHAPSAENRQPWEFVIVRDPDTRAAIGELTRKAWEEHGRAFSESRLTPKLLADVDKGATGGIAAAPVHVVVCADIERGLEVTIGSSIFPAVQNLLLAATAAARQRSRRSRRRTADSRAVALPRTSPVVVRSVIRPATRARCGRSRRTRTAEYGAW